MKINKSEIDNNLNSEIKKWAIFHHKYLTCLELPSISIKKLVVQRLTVLIYNYQRGLEESQG